MFKAKGIESRVLAPQAVKPHSRYRASGCWGVEFQGKGLEGTDFRVQGFGAFVTEVLHTGPSGEGPFK